MKENSIDNQELLLTKKNKKSALLQQLMRVRSTTLGNCGTSFKLATI